MKKKSEPVAITSYRKGTRFADLYLHGQRVTQRSSIQNYSTL